MTRLSNRQYPMLRLFAQRYREREYMSIDDAQKWDQRPFRSMLIQKWVEYVPGKGFHVTPKGEQALYEFGHTDIRRSNPYLPLTSFFDVSSYGLSLVRKPPRKESRAAMRKAG